MKSRSLKVTIMIIAVLSVGLGLLLNPFIQNAAAHCGSIPCDDAMNDCRVYEEAARVVCRYYSAEACQAAIDDGIMMCVFLLWHCAD